MNISGKIKLIGETKEYGSNGFRKREIVITTQEQYPQNILIEFKLVFCVMLFKMRTAKNIKLSV